MTSTSIVAARLREIADVLDGVLNDENMPLLLRGILRDRVRDLREIVGQLLEPDKAATHYGPRTRRKGQASRTQRMVRP